MPRIEIGIGAIVAGAAGLGLGKYDVFQIVLLILGSLLIAHGAYDVYFKPNILLDKTVARWLSRHYWRVRIDIAATPANSYFAFWVQDDGGRRVMVSRERDVKNTLAFTAPIDLDPKVLALISAKLSTVEQQRLYEDIHVLLASMHLGYASSTFSRITIQHALPIDEQLSEQAVDLKAKEVANGVIAARSIITRAVL
jgi:hypothetical protein